MLCEIPKSALNKSGCLKVEEVAAIQLSGCEIPEGTCFDVETKMAEPLKADVRAVTPPDLAPAGAPVAAPPVTTASVEQPALDPAAQLAQLAGQKDIGGAGLIAGIVGVVGGGAALKFYRDWIKGKQDVDSKKSEQDFELKKMELENKKHQQDEGHKACSVERAALAAQLTGMTAQLQAATAKIEELSGKIGGLSHKLDDVSSKSERTAAKVSKIEPDFDTEELEARLAKLEKKSARTGARAKT